MGCIYFEQKYFCAGRGYGYVAASRFRTRGGCYLYGHMRRTDFLPVDGKADEEVSERGCESLSDDDDEGQGLEYADDSLSNVAVDIADLVAKEGELDDFQ